MAPVSPPPVSLLDAEYVDAIDCPPAGCESPGSVVTAPPGVVQSRGTSKRGRNRLVWLQVQLFLEDLPSRSRSAS